MYGKGRRGKNKDDLRWLFGAGVLRAIFVMVFVVVRVVPIGTDASRSAASIFFGGMVVIWFSYEVWQVLKQFFRKGL